MRLTRPLCALLAAGCVFSGVTPAHALSDVTGWAQSEVQAAAAAGLEPSSLADAHAVAPITRAEFCEVGLSLYNTMSGKTVQTVQKSPFSDTNSSAVATAHALGLVSGRGDGIFDPDGAITRQELCKLLDNVLVAANCTRPSADLETIADFSDRTEIASWATDAVERMLGAQVMRGISRTTNDGSGEAVSRVELQPTARTTREQALIIALRFTKAFQPAGSGTTSGSTASGSTVAIPADPDGSISSRPDSDTTASTNPDSSTTTDADKPTGGSTVPSTLPRTQDEKMAFVFGSAGSFFETPALAEAAMTEISVPVWRLNNGKKTAGKAYLTVNRNLAAICTAIFIEIYNGDEKFPISDVGGYAWRPSPTSEHRWGTAIDINYDANMEATINADGSLTPTCGTHYTPGEDPFSIPENGDVYNAFTKYGFAWGGNAWRSKRDYMHFSYFGK